MSAQEPVLAGKHVRGTSTCRRTAAPRAATYDSYRSVCSFRSMLSKGSCRLDLCVRLLNQDGRNAPPPLFDCSARTLCVLRTRQPSRQHGLNKSTQAAHAHIGNAAAAFVHTTLFVVWSSPSTATLCSCQSRKPAHRRSFAPLFPGFAKASGLCATEQW